MFETLYYLMIIFVECKQSLNIVHMFAIVLMLVLAAFLSFINAEHVAVVTCDQHAS